LRQSIFLIAGIYASDLSRRDAQRLNAMRSIVAAPSQSATRSVVALSILGIPAPFTLQHHPHQSVMQCGKAALE
jgi:hypothetical protein